MLIGTDVVACRGTVATLGPVVLRCIGNFAVDRYTRALRISLNLLPVQIAVVVTRVDRRLTTVNLDDLVRNLPYQRTIMRDEAYRASIIA